MKSDNSRRLHAVVAIVLLTGQFSLFAQEQRKVVRPEDTGEALANPGMGWGFHYYSNVPTNYGSKLEPSDTLDDFGGLTHIYLRIPWSYVEPQEGKFNWSVLDTPAQRWSDKGRKIAIRISCCESWMRYATPEWVHKAGAKGHNFRPGKGVTEQGPYWEPDYDDRVFLEKLDNFLAALAAIAGHNWSVFLRFRGGSGVATFFGGLAALSTIVALFGGQILILVAVSTGFVSLGSIAGVVGTYAILVPLTVLNGFPIEYLVYALIGTLAIIVMHRDNISRLMSGKERKLGEKVEKTG